MEELFNTAGASTDLSFEAVSSALTDAEMHKVLVEWNQTAKDYPRDKCIHELFEEQVERSPEAVAVAFGDQHLTYRELNNRANQLAHHLQSLGVCPEVLVGICMERSPEMIVGLFGILKAGGAYVPFDPEYPRERLVFMIDDADVRVLLTQGRAGQSVPAGRAKIINLDEEWPTIAVESCANPRTPMTGNHLAYVIYTSGSTGLPKGAMNTHEGIVNRLLWMQDAYRLKAADRVLQKTPFSFDVSVWEFFWPVIAGARVVIALPEKHKDSAYLAKVIDREKITTIHFVPSMLNAFLEQEGLEASCLSLRRVICSGEVLSYELQQRFFSRLSCELHNLYGPTEASVDVTHWTCERNSPVHKVPIGRPIANTQIYILNQRLMPVPVGVPGELCIGGIGLARGYHKRPELTAEKFIPNPFSSSSEPTSRLYKSGDLARYLQDGTIEYLGRLDDQVKVRGFRIEVGEIETVMELHPNIKRAVVVAREYETGEKHLAAYVIIAQGQPTPTVSELREFLLTKLPDHMVPAAFVSLREFPLAPNGKIDRKALPVPEGNRLGLGTRYDAPRTPTEEKLAAIWSDVLGVEKIGIHDNFFHLGGHSLNAVRIVTRIRDIFKRELPVRSIIELATIDKLSHAINEAPPWPQTGFQVRKGLPVAASEHHEERRLVPASFNQAQLWFLQQLNPGSVAYNLGHLVRFNGVLNIDALRASLNELIRRHESLRTTFESVNGELMQVIVSPVPADLRTVDLQKFPEDRREAEVQRIVAVQMSEPFDLKQGPLLLLKLLRLDEQHHALVIGIHHIIYDGWSNDVLLRELGDAYAAFCSRGNARLPDPSIQYADFAMWQREHLNSQVIDGHLAYWRRQLQGVPTIMDLPTDGAREVKGARRRAQRCLRLSQETTMGLRSLAQDQNCTLFVTLMAAFQVLLHRHTGQESILVGAPFAGRLSSEVENVIGYFVNTLPIKADFSTDPTFIELLGQVRDAVWEAQEHQDLPFERLVKELRAVRDASRNPLFQVLIAFEMPSAPRHLQGLTLTTEESPRTESMFDMTLELAERDGELECLLSCNADVFGGATATRLLDHYQQLLASVLADPRNRASALRMVTDEEKHRILVEWNQMQVEYPRDKCVHELFEEQVERTPEAVAVVFENERLMYRELNSRANQLAHHLRSLGVGPEVLVGVCVERSLEMIIGLLAILKAGGAYLPLDPDYPRERLAFLLRDTNTSVLLTQTKFVADLSENQAKVICLDEEEQSALRAQLVANPIPGTKPENLAYVIFTSGSTGQPKGVEITHRGVVRLVKNNDYASFAPEEVFLQMAPLAFDASTFEIWGPLLNGAKLVVMTPGTPTFEEIGRRVREHGVTTLWLTAGLFHTIIRDRVDELKTLRQLLAGGDVLSPTIVNLAVRGLRGCRLINGYGPTESTTFACCYRIKDSQSSRRSVPIGRPIANTQVYILDSQLEPVPIGVAGELHIGGDGLARGYLNDPELTAQKFIPNPFSNEPGARLYKTGDLARYLPDGNIEFLGRADHQVKIRGFRIELGEIESVLAAHPNLQSAVVTAREDKSGDKQLVAYVVAKAGTSPTASELREFLKEKLPKYMVPAVFIRLSTFPLTPNGKIDRKALPAPEGNQLESGSGYEAPRTPTQEKLAAIWSEVLGVQKIGIHDNFFHLGGHSLMAARLISMINRKMQLDLRVLSLFQLPTVKEMADSLQIPSPAIRERLISLKMGNSLPDVVILLDEGSPGLLQLGRLLDERLSVYASDVPLDQAIVKSRIKGKEYRVIQIEQYAEAHAQLIRDRQKNRGCVLVGRCFGGMLAFEVARQLERTGTPVEAVLMLNTWMRETSPLAWYLSWLRAHLGYTLKYGLGYIWTKSRRRVALELDESATAFSKSGEENHADYFPPRLLRRIYRHALRDYQPQPFAGKGILMLSEEDWAANAFRKDDDTLGARFYFRGGIKVVNVPGNHVTVLNREHLESLATRFNECLLEICRVNAA